MPRTFLRALTADDYYLPVVCCSCLLSAELEGKKQPRKADKRQHKRVKKSELPKKPEPPVHLTGISL